jgi:hypothetical protein
MILLIETIFMCIYTYYLNYENKELENLNIKNDLRKLKRNP